MKSTVLSFLGILLFVPVKMTQAQINYSNLFGLITITGYTNSFRVVTMPRKIW